MIRPFTCIAFLLACGSGLYLYQAKHRVKVLDDEIAHTMKSTDALREQTRMLSAEWTLLNDPERLRQLASQFLTLQTVSPNQFTSLADLDSRLPAPLPPVVPPAAGAAPSVMAQQTTPSPNAADAPSGQIAAALAATTAPPAATVVKPDNARPSDVAPKASATAVAAAHDAAPAKLVAVARAETSHGNDHRPAPRVAAMEQRPPEQRGDAWRPPIEAAQRSFIPRSVERRPVMAVRAPMPVPLPGAGSSLLGMAHDMAAPPPPRPMPISAPMVSDSEVGG